MSGTYSAIKMLFECDPDYGIMPVYTHTKENADKLLELTDEKYRAHVIEYDHVAHAIACHLGPNAYGYIFVSQK